MKSIALILVLMFTSTTFAVTAIHCGKEKETQLAAIAALNDDLLVGVIRITTKEGRTLQLIIESASAPVLIKTNSGSFVACSTVVGGAF